jgi:hypothetical protein
MKIAAIVLLCVGLAGCGAGGNISALDPVCEAVSAGKGPIRYNAENINSRRHAGPDLAPVLAAKNQVGINLSCKGYTRISRILH